jgi:hypothetical protein
LDSPDARDDTSPCFEALHVTRAEVRVTVFVHDFLPLERTTPPLAVAIRAAGARMIERAIAKGRLPSPAVVDVGDVRDRDDVVVLPVRIRSEDVHAPFVVLDVDLQVAPLAPGWTHLSLSGTFERNDHGLGRRVDRLVDQRRTEAYLRSMLLDVAAELDRAATPAEAAHV